MTDPTEALLTALKACVGVLILATGMSATWRDLVFLWQRPRLLLRSLLAMYVCVPLAALALVKLLPLRAGAEAALLVLAVSAGAPLLPRKLRRFEGDAYVFSLVASSSLLAIVLVPLWLHLLVRWFGGQAEAELAVVARLIAKAFVLPLAAGMLLRALLGARAVRLAERLLTIGSLVLAVAAAALLAMHWDIWRTMSVWGIVALVGQMMIALAIGHALGGPKAEHRTALATVCATRHVGVALLVASAFPGPRTAALIAGYLLVATAVTLPYLQWRAKRQGAAQ